MLGGNEFFYRFIRAVLYIIYRVCFRFRYYGAENVPSARDRRGVILAPNHASYLDPPILGISLDRRVTYLAKEYLFRHPVVGFVLRSIGAYPIKSDSGNDFRSIRDLVRILKDGRCVVVFPEGTRSTSGDLKDPESGIGFLAMKSGAWVVPVYIEGSFEAMPRASAKGGSASGGKSFQRKPIRAFYGEAFIPAQNRAWEAMQDYAGVSRKIMMDIRALRDKAEQNL